MATITATRKAYKATGATTDCMCTRIVRPDGQVFRFTSAAEDLNITHKIDAEGEFVALASPVVYSAVQATSSSAFGVTENQPGMIDVEGVLSAFGFERDSIISGLWDRSRVYLFWTNYIFPFEDEEKITTGYWGEVTLIDGRYVAKFTSLIDLMNIPVGRRHTKNCAVDFGGDECKVPLDVDTWLPNSPVNAADDRDASILYLGGATSAIVKPTTPGGLWFRCTTTGNTGATEPAWPTVVGATVTDDDVVWTAIAANTITTTIDTVLASNSLRLAIDTPSPSHFATGYLEFLDGDNIGNKIMIISSTHFEIRLAFPPLKPLKVGDQVKLIAGCTKRKSGDCITRFHNVANFRGFPDVPDQSTVLSPTNIPKVI